MLPGGISIAHINGPCAKASQCPRCKNVWGLTPPGASGHSDFVRVLIVPLWQNLPKKHLCLHLKCTKFFVFKANFLHLKELKKKNIREPPHCTGNEPTQEIYVGGLGWDIKKTK